jgi:hypothetical protein
MAGPGKNYVLGKGKLYFDMIEPGKTVGIGERYFGNTPELSSAQSQDTLDHIDADQGMNVKDEQVTISNDMTLTFASDNIEPDNFALWYGGDVDKMTVAAAPGITDPNQITLKRGLWYQVGVDADTPSGTRNISNVVISKVVPPVPPATDPTLAPITNANNVDVDLVRGRIYIEPDAPDLVDGDVLSVTYDQGGITRTVIVSKGKEIRGALRYIADNPVGPNSDHFWPYVKLTPNGDFALKGDTWQQMSFTAEVLKKDGTTERLYIDGVAAP